MSRLRDALRGRLLRLGRSLRAAAAEIAVSAAVLGGWALLTWGVARLTSPDAWIFSGGLLLLSLTGWRWLGELFWMGLYVMSREDDE